jgi:hypothetical protein
LLYFDGVLDVVARHHHIRTGTSRKTLISELQRRSSDRGVEIDLGGLRQELKSLSGSELHQRDAVVRMAGTLHEWRQEMMDEH